MALTPLESLRLQLSGCEDCGSTDINFTKKGLRKEAPRVRIPKSATSLIDSSRQPVPGSGAVHPKYCIVGEAPGDAICCGPGAALGAIAPVGCPFRDAPGTGFPDKVNLSRLGSLKVSMSLRKSSSETRRVF